MFGRSLVRFGVLGLGIAWAISASLPWLGVVQYQAREEARIAALAEGLKAVDAGRYEEAIPLLLPSAKRGDKRAILKLAEAIAFDSRQDADEEALWFAKAAAINPVIVYQLATKLEATSWGLENTIDLYDEAARNGSGDARARLARVYQDAQLALDGGDEEAGLELASLLAGTGEYWDWSHDLFIAHADPVKTDEGVFFDALRSVYKRAKDGDAYAALDLGRSFSSSPLVEGAARDHQLAVGWLQLAAIDDDLSYEDAAAAMYWLGLEYVRCGPECRDDTRALLWFTLADQTCSRIGTDELYRPCVLAKGASLGLRAGLTKDQLDRVSALAREWSQGHKASALAPIPSDVLHPAPLQPTPRDALATANADDYFLWLGSFDELNEAELQLWTARHIDGIPSAGSVALECRGSLTKYAAAIGPAPSSALKQICQRKIRNSDCRKVSRSQLIEMCAPPSS
jgi:TPR repeat protein